MDCHQVKAQLDNGSTMVERDDALRAHLATCANCAAYADELVLLTSLRCLPVRPPRKGFEQQALQNTLSVLPRRSTVTARWGYAVAASLALVAIAVVATRSNPVSVHVPETPTFTVLAEPLQTRAIDVVLDSPRAVEAATFIVTLDDNLMLERRPNTRELRWHARVSAGGNRLSLPVQLLGPGDGEMTVTLEYGDRRQQVRIRVRHAAAEGGTRQTAI